MSLKPNRHLPPIHQQGHSHKRPGLIHLLNHSHRYDELASDPAFLNHEMGLRTIWLALGILLLTTMIQLTIVATSGSVALLADTIHNLGDSLNSIPLLIAFYLARRAPTRRYTYGFGKAEDMAGIFIVLSIVLSAGVIFWQSFQKLLNPQPLTNPGWLVTAAIVGFLGNEAVALLQIRMGKRIGSAALVADGLHARTDGLTSLAVLVAVGGYWLGYPLIDPIMGFLIGITILFVTRNAMKTMWYRLMDAIEPEILDQMEVIVQQQVGVKALRRLRMRWAGHRLQAEIIIAVDPQLTIAEGHHITEELRHALFHQVTNLAEVAVHVDPWSPLADVDHEVTIHHEKLPQPMGSPVSEASTSYSL